MIRKWGYTLMVFLLFFGVFPFCCNGQDYLIGAEDVIEVIVWNEPNFSREVVVRPDGKISLPAVGDVQVEGLTPEALTEHLQEVLAQYIKTPKVSVVIRLINSQKVYVLGQVRTPGVFPLQGEMTILQAIARAGGVTEWAKTGGIILLRKTKEGDQRIVVNLRKIIKGSKKGGEDVRLQAGDKIIVP
jgi:polysaccharide export outer membrane protein